MLWRHFANRARGVNVFALSDGSFCQDTATPENENTNIPYPWDPDNPSGPYVYVHNWNGTVSAFAHAIWVATMYAGGHSYKVSSAVATALTNYTAHGRGYADCLS